MFKITQNTINGFTLAEILLMAAMNEIEAKKKASAMVSNHQRAS
jgi:flagellar biosynthesis chaperone FliJ